MKQQKTINERTPVAGDVWWINKTTGAQDMHFIVQAFDKVALTLKLIEKEPYSNGVQVEGMWVDAKMVSYAFYTRFDVYEGGTKQETLENVQQAVMQAIGCGKDIPQDAQEITRLRGEIIRLENAQEAHETTSEAVINALREKANKLEKAKEESQPAGRDVPMKAGERTQAVLNYGVAKNEAQIYKTLYFDVLNRLTKIASGKPDQPVDTIHKYDGEQFPAMTEADGIPF